jgi:capsular exopolysaccharide synthesis family protein
MSKIIEALEKAKREGTMDRSVTTIDERDTLVPLPREGAVVREPAGPGHRRRKHRSHGHLMVAQEMDPELLRNVEAHVDVLLNPMSVVSEQYRALRSRIERLNFEGKIQTLALTSAAKGEGKSLTALNLALVMAQDGTKDVLLVDADLRRPKLHKLLGLEPSPGLGDFFRGGASAQEIVRRTPFFGLAVTTAGSVGGHPGELLASPEFEEWVAVLRSEFDYIFFDTPPIHPVSDVNFLAPSVDAILLVVRAGKTPRGLVKHAAETLPAGKLVGSILNRAENVGPGYGYGYRKGDYYYKYY